MSQFFALGQRVRFTETFTDLIAGALTDPTTVTLKLHDPTGTETAYTYAGAQVVRDSLGVYHYDFTLSIAGNWIARWVASGTIVATDEKAFKVTGSGFTAP